MSTDTDVVLLRGDAAAQAVPVDFIHRPPTVGGAAPVGPWAERLSETKAQAREEGWQEGRRLGLHEARVESQRQAEALAIAVAEELRAAVAADGYAAIAVPGGSTPRAFLAALAAAPVDWAASDSGRSFAGPRSRSRRGPE